MAESLLARDALALIDDKQLLDEILAVVADCFEFAVLEVVVGTLDLAEDLGGVFALERQVAAD